MRIWRWLVTLAPALIGIGLALFFFLSYDRAYDHIVYLRADLGTLSLILGFGISALVALVFVLLGWSARTRRQAVAAAAEERRRFLRRLDHELKNPLTAIRGRSGQPGRNALRGTPPGGPVQCRSPGPAPQPPLRRPAQAGRVGSSPGGAFAGGHSQPCCARPSAWPRKTLEPLNGI